MNSRSSINHGAHRRAFSAIFGHAIFPGEMRSVQRGARLLARFQGRA
jgi:hypothetical protein